MEHVELGATGHMVPIIGVGTSRYGGDVEALRCAIDAGASFIDTAELYESEEIVGRAARGMRERCFIASKVWRTNLRRPDLLRAADESLKRLETDYIDLYQVHWPNPRVPIEETMGAMEELVDSGRVRFIGVSNFSRRQLERARAALQRHPLVSNQLEYSLIDRYIEQDLLPACRVMNVTVIAYSPLGLGPERLERRDRHAALERVSSRTGKTRAQVALNWCIGGGGVIAIPKSNSVERMRENCGAAGWRLSPADRRLLETSIRARRHRGILEREARDLARNLLERSGVGRTLIRRAIRRPRP